MDFSLTFQIEGLAIRGRLVRLGSALEQMLLPHSYPGPVAEIMAETVTLAATLGSALKYDGVFGLQTQSDGPVSIMVADVTSNGAIRGYARFDDEKIKLLDNNAGAPVPRLLGAGYMAFSVDQGPHTERYQGISELDGATLADCAHHYFRNSEQLESAIWLGADAGKNQSGAGAMSGAIMIQRMPQSGPQSGKDIEDEEDGWRRAVAILSSLKRDELLSDELSAEELLYRLYNEDGVRIFEKHDLFHQCRCSEEKVINTIKSFPIDEITDENGNIRVTCEFCKQVYSFDHNEIKSIIAN
ncbi:MAG: Hsp33 family molecular chaperone HslO [Rhodospirillaceae bacterium]|nr:Hsp33 family molecular chaperone HslO [Rhodospirillaceae bacterium]